MVRSMSGRAHSMLSSASRGVGSSGAHETGDIARARRACNTSKHLIVAAANRAASGGGAGFVDICAEILSRACKNEKRLFFVPGEGLGGSTLSVAVAVGGMSSVCDLLAFDILVGSFFCSLFLFEADGVGFVSPTVAAAARVASNSACSSSARLCHVSHSSDIDIVAERQK